MARKNRLPEQPDEIKNSVGISKSIQEPGFPGGNRPRSAPSEDWFAGRLRPEAKV